jgi:hypothetical protein
MQARLVVLSSLLATATGVMVLAGPTPLVPAPDTPLRVGAEPSSVAIGDINNDRMPDLVVTSAQRRVNIFLGHGDGRFSLAPAGTFETPENASELALGDVNSDGQVDLAVASHESYNVGLLYGDGRGGFRPAANSPIAMKDGRAPHTHGLRIVDINGDGKADLVTVNSNDDNDVAVMLGDGRGRFARAPGSPFAVGPGPYPLAVGDLDGDGRLDLAVTSTGFRTGPLPPLPSNRLTLLFGDGRGGFRRSDVPVRHGHTWFVAIGDLNNDRQADIVTTHGDAPLVTVLLSDGRGSFAESPGSPFALGQQAHYIALVDLNRDGQLDVVGATGTSIRGLIGDGRGGFTTAPTSVYAPGRGMWKLAVADVNADGKADVAASNFEADSVTVLLGR